MQEVYSVRTCKNTYLFASDCVYRDKKRMMRMQRFFLAKVRML
jgi:hypothetical protein